LYGAIARGLVEDGADVTYVTRRQWPQGVHAGLDFPVDDLGSITLYDERGVRRPWGSVLFATRLAAYLFRRRRRFDAVYASALPSLNVFAVRIALLGRRIPILFDWPEIWTFEQSTAYSGRTVGAIAFVLQRFAIALTPRATVYGPMSVRNWHRNRGRGTPMVLGMIDDALVAHPALEQAHPPFALYVGRHIPDKQVESIPAAIALARQVVPDLQAVVLGDGPTKMRVEAAIRDAGMDGLVELPGFVDEDSLSSYLSRASVLVHPSRREGFGMVVVEAASYGTPAVVVSGTENAAADLVHDGVNGFVAGSTEAPALAAAIVSAIQGGNELRRSTAAWFEGYRKDGTMRASARRIAAVLAPEATRIH
jgi:glycosyltransferase involved in cell wall biosynthesis